MDTLELLKSLTQGVNNKVSQEQNKTFEYIVDTSLKKRGQKGKLPIIKEVIEEKPIKDNNDEEYILEGDIIEESDVIDEVIENDIENSEEIVGNDVEDNQEEVLEDVILDIVDEPDGHKSEKIKVEKESKRIERNGNPFKRGPRKKKEKVIEEVQHPPMEEKEKKEEIKEEVKIEDDNVIFENEEQVSVPEVKEEQIEDLGSLEDNVEIESVSEIEEKEAVSEIEENEEDLDTEIEDEISIENTESNEDVNDIVTNNDKTELGNEEDSNLIDEELITVTDEDEKFKNCKYYRGMDIEEYLRENPNYRDSVYVEHFYSKEYLNQQIVKGLILIKKGQYRL